MTPVFGVFPEIRHRHYHFPKGNIYLKYGVHYRQGNGWGLNHIWEAHQHELIPLGYPDYNHAAAYVADILQTGARIHCEFEKSLMGKPERPTIIKSDKGIAVVEHRLDGLGDDIYSVITAYNYKNVHGQLIGKLK